MNSSAHQQPVDPEVGVYECEVKLKFRIIEEKGVMQNRDQLLELLVDAVAYGDDDFVESLQSEVSLQEISEVDASPEMRRQLIRLRNANWR
ncbi:Npun_R1517 family heterocyst differentiation transcriptional regulator [Pseudanabaena sp. FACHB-2040]|uniref:Npun_R1517 family heterocyst differentiation transcriptional regulator n=1 Tax=Pseudanabaena sp. FACHB-2040 TaxID=2692859 RepID=UPI001683EF8C|nr:Npun_R1517 family heterocyst differentiation transcriptional regulator [Pseudanabaena sp. FACHB-2040]MBD2258882.1 Npun_R1517 family heterocyst differentiation transcriptional regulator [Pseudanabaena sp. FACHB-2040]